MKKNFVFIHICFVFSMVAFAGSTLRAVNFDDFFKDLFGPQPQQQQRWDEPEERWDEPAKPAPIKKAPGVPAPAAKKSQETGQTIRAKLVEFKNSLGKLNNSTQDIKLHRPQARQQLLALIQGKPENAAAKAEPEPKPAQRGRAKEDDKPKLPSFKAQGAVGAIALSDLITDEPAGIYSNNLAAEKNAPTQKLLTDILHKLSDI